MLVFFPESSSHRSSSFVVLDDTSVFSVTILGINLWIIVGAGGGMVVNTQIYYTFINVCITRLTLLSSVRSRPGADYCRPNRLH